MEDTNHPLTVHGPTLGERLRDLFLSKAEDLTAEDKEEDPSWFDTLAEETAAEVFAELADELSEAIKEHLEEFR